MASESFEPLKDYASSAEFFFGLEYVTRCTAIEQRKEQIKELEEAGAVTAEKQKVKRELAFLREVQKNNLKTFKKMIIRLRRREQQWLKKDAARLYRESLVQ